MDIDNWNEIWITLSRNKTRSLLTCFGVFWGILMLIILLGLCEGLKNGIEQNVKGIATNTCFFYTDITSEPYKGLNRGRSWNMHNADIEHIAHHIKHIEYISPILFSKQGEKNIKYNALAGSFIIKGVNSNYFNIEIPHIIEGRIINFIDNNDKRKVCIIGSHVSEAFFTTHRNSIGKYLNIEGIYYQVVGVIRAKSSINIAGSIDESIFIPFKTFQQTKNIGDEFRHLCITIYGGYSGDQLSKEVKTLLKNQNKISPFDEQAVGVINIAQEFHRFSNLYLCIYSLTWFVGLGTLLAGIIGINNIMLVTVRERTQEIGIRRALGAKPRDIISQILSESVVLSSASGILGLITGVNILFLLDFILSLNLSETTFFVHPLIKTDTAVYVLFFLVICGLISGLLPTMKALIIKPIDAIQDE